MQSCTLLLAAIIGLGWGISSAYGQGAADEPMLLGMSLEELMEMEVTVAGKQEQSIWHTPAAVYVITQEDIRRSGATTVPELLRMAPGVHVAAINSNFWAVTIRGFSAELSNKLLVMVDGRPVYDEMYNGTNWNSQEMLLDNIERIEIVRGPGGTVWGTNAVNGVINIITKDARETQGGYLTGGGGNQEHGFGGARYGGKLGEDAWFRAYGKYVLRENAFLRGGDEAHDDYESQLGGFRLDWDASEDDRLTMTGEIYEHKAGGEGSLQWFGRPGEAEPDSEEDVDRGHLLGRWTHRFSETSELSLQGYYDHGHMVRPWAGGYVNRFGVDFQHTFVPLEGHRLIWGGEYRYLQDQANGSELINWTPSERATDLASLFVQDEINLAPERLWLTLGSKFEHNDFTGFELQPSARLSWTPDENNTLWGSITRAVRTPSRGDHDFRMEMPFEWPGALPVVFASVGSEEFTSEELLAYEAGYRVRPNERLTLDFAGYVNDYDRLGTNDLTTVEMRLTPEPHWYVLGANDNHADGVTYGFEMAANWAMTPRWKLAAAYTFERLDIDADEGVIDLTNKPALEGATPSHLFHVRSFMNVTEELEFDILAYYSDSLASQEVPSYLRLDLRLGWQISEALELSVVGQNMLDGRHPEFVSYGRGVEVPRGYYARLTWRF